MSEGTIPVEYFLGAEDSRKGPYSASEVRRRIRSGQVKLADMVLRGSSTTWVPVGMCPEFRKPAPLIPDPAKELSAANTLQRQDFYQSGGIAEEPFLPAACHSNGVTTCLASTGALLTIFGLFAPVVTLLQGEIHFSSVGWPAYLMMGLAIASIAAAVSQTAWLLCGTSISAFTVYLGCLVKFVSDVQNAKRTVAEAMSSYTDLLGHMPGTRAAADAVTLPVNNLLRLEWGCFVLGLGVALIVASALVSLVVPKEATPRYPWERY